MIRFLFRALLALLMIGIVFGLVGLYLWEVTGGDDYTPPERVEDNENEIQSLQWDEVYNDSAPQWSPDADSIAFMSTRSGDLDIWVVSSDGSSLHNLTENSQRVNSWPVWSPDGQLIAFESFQSLNTDIWIMGADGANPTNLTAENDVINRQPEWSSNGQTIAYNVINSELRQEIQLVDITSREIRVLVSASDRDYIAFDWSPNLTQIAVVEMMVTENDTESNTNPEPTRVLIFSVDGFLLQTYRPTQPVSDVKWSPDGDKFLLTVSNQIDSTDSSEADFIIMDFDGSEQEIVIPEHYSVLGNWSPNGDMFVFSATGTSRSDILVVNVVGNNLRNLTEESDIFATRSDWSPNGSQIVFSGFQHQGDDSAIADYNDNIWVMNADGSNLMNLTGGN